MKGQKFNFFKRIVSAIKLDNYIEMSGEKITNAIKFLAKLMIIFAIVISVAITIKFNNMLNDGSLMEYLDKVNEYGIKNNISEEMLESITNVERIYVCIPFYIITVIYTFIAYFVLTLMDVLLLSILGFIVSRFFRINFKYGVIYNISVYSLVLSIIFNMIYIFTNLLTNYKIEYFGVVYNVISYIYLIAAILIIKSDIIKTNIEVMAVVNEQEKIKNELEEEKNQEEKQDEDKENDKDKENKKENDNSNGIPTPEGEN